MWATRQRKSTGASGSPFSSSPLAGHIPHIDFGSHIVRWSRQSSAAPARSAVHPSRSVAPQVELVLLRQHADAESTLGIDGKRGDSAAAVIHLVGALGRVRRSGVIPGKVLPRVHPPGILEVERHEDFGRQAHGERTL